MASASESARVGAERDLAPEDRVEPEDDADPQAHDALAEHVERLVERRLRERQHAVGAHEQRIERRNAPEGHRLVGQVDEGRLVKTDHPGAHQECRVSCRCADGGTCSHPDDDRERGLHTFTSRTDTLAWST